MEIQLIFYNPGKIMAIMERKTAAKLKTNGKSLGFKIKLIFWEQDFS